MSLDPARDALVVSRPVTKAGDPRMVSARQTDDVRETRAKDRTAFADMLRSNRARADDNKDVQDTKAQDAKAQDTTASERAADQDAKPIQPDQSEATAAPAAPSNKDKPVDTAKTVPAQSADQATVQSDDTTLKASETVAAQDNTDPLTSLLAQAKAQLTPEQVPANPQSPPVQTTAADAKVPEPKLADAASDVPVTNLVQALNDLKSALRGQATQAETSETETDATKVDGETPAEPALTDAQLNQLMQTLLSGKPLTPELKTLSETPKVAEALKAVRSAMAALETKRPERVITADVAPVLETDGQAVKTSDMPKAPERKADTAFADLSGTKPTISPAVKTETQAQTGAIAPETVTTQTAPAAVSEAARALPKPSDAPAEVKHVLANSANDAPVVAPEAAKAAEGLQLARSEAALGSNLSNAALNNLTHMSAQIARHMTAKSTQFNMELHPADMGRVDVKLSINHDGTMSAALSFDSPVAESQFRAQADELRRQLEAQGFQLAEGSLSFSSRQGSDQASQGQSSPSNASDFIDEAPDASRAAQAFGALEQTLDAPAPGARLAQKLGLDLLGAQTYRLSLNVTA